MTNKKAILVVSFGTSHRETCEENIGAIERAIGAACPDREIRRAFTSGMIIRKLWERDRLRIDTVSEALERLISDGFQEALLQPTHIINGAEFDGVVADAEPFSRHIRLQIGAPLLTDTEDYRQVAGAVGRAFPVAPDTALCLMGHGSAHPADAAYAALDYHFKDLGRKDIFVGAVEGFPDLDTLVRQVSAFGAKRVVLTPLMVVAGDHAVNDMAGEEEDSWKRVFEAAEFQVECVQKGLGQYPEIRDLYVAHTKTAAR